MKWLSIFAILFTCGQSWAGDIEWKGTYRFEGVTVQNPGMALNEETTAYMLHHLVLMPKITAYDGLTIHGRFDILNADTAQYPEYMNSQMGDFLGNGPGAAAPTDSSNSNVLAENQQSSLINVNELYLTYAHEFGVLTAGRAPIHFGLGMTYNNGHGEFDHWFDNRDMVAYKFITGNLFFMPAIAKLSEGALDTADDVDDYIMQVQYENPDTELTIGLLYRRRHASSHGNDVPTALFGGAPTTVTPVASFEGEYWSFFLSRYITDSIKIGLEGGLQKGETGVLSTAGGSIVEFDSYGIALELDYIPEGSSFNFNLMAGVASGDDPTTANSYEGYMFDRNYDVAMLLFNRPLGQYDLFRTGYVRTTPVGQTASSYADIEALSNVLYISPRMNYKWSEKWQSQLGLTYARLNSDPIGNGVDKGVGIEVDISLDYRPYEGVRWMNQIGVLFPGGAFEGGPTNNFNTETVFGIETKAAITF